MKKTRKILISMFTLGIALKNVAYAASSSSSSSEGFPIKYIFMGVAFLVIVLLLFLGYKMDTRSTETYVAPKKSKKKVNTAPESTLSAQSINSMNNLNSEDDIVFPNKVYVDENEESLFATTEENDYQGFTTAESLKESQELDKELNGSYNPPVEEENIEEYNDVVVEDEAIDKDNTEEIDNTLIMNNIYDDNTNNVNEIEDINTNNNVIDESPISPTEEINPDIFGTSSEDNEIESDVDFSNTVIDEPEEVPNVDFSNTEIDESKEESNTDFSNDIIDESIEEPDVNIEEIEEEPISNIENVINEDEEPEIEVPEEPEIELNEEPEEIEEPSIEPIDESINDDEEYGEEFDTSIIDDLDNEDDSPVVSTILDTSPRKADETIMFNTGDISSLSGKSLNDEIDELDDIEDIPDATIEEPINDLSDVEIPEENNTEDIPEEYETEDDTKEEYEPEEYYDDVEEDNATLDENVPEPEEVEEDIPEDILDEDDDDYYEEEEPIDNSIEESVPEDVIEEDIPDEVEEVIPEEDILEENPEIEYTDPVDIDFGILDEEDDSTTSNVDSFVDDLKKFDEPADDFAGFTVAAKEEPVEPKTKPKRFTRIMPKEFTVNNDNNIKKETSVSDEEITDDDIEDNDFYENDFLKQMEENIKNNNEFDDEDDDDNKY